MKPLPLNSTALILGCYLVLHVSLEVHLIYRGFMIPTIWEMLEWALTFPLSIWQFCYGLPGNGLARLVYYVLVVANSLLLGMAIRRLRQGLKTGINSEPRDEGGDEGL